MPTLLEKAQEYRTPTIRGKRLLYESDEYIQLAKAWLDDNVTGVQIKAVIGEKNSGGHYLYGVAIALKKLYREGKLIIKE